jgi:hypothetical protein
MKIIGTAAILGALSLHCISAMALMRPPSSWKAKFRNKKSIKVNDQLDENKKLLVPGNSLPGPREIQVLKRGEKWNSCRSLQEDDRNKNLDLVIIAFHIILIFICEISYILYLKNI